MFVVMVIFWDGSPTRNVFGPFCSEEEANNFSYICKSDFDEKYNEDTTVKVVPLASPWQFNAVPAKKSQTTVTKSNPHIPYNLSANIADR